MRARQAAWRLGYDLDEQARGSGPIPIRFRRVLPIGPLDDGRRAVPTTFTVATARSTCFLGFSFDDTGWNPLVETLREFEADASLTYERSTMARLHERFQPTTLDEVLFAGGAPHPPLDRIGADRRFYRYIWLSSAASVRSAVGAAPVTTPNYYFGPHPAERGQAEFDRLIATFRSIRDEGFQPERYGSCTGYLIGDEDAYRFVVGSGNHRLAALAALGIEQFPARLHSHPAVVHRTQLPRWTTDQGGPFEPGTAEALYDLLVHQDGRQRAIDLGLA